MIKILPSMYFLIGLFSPSYLSIVCRIFRVLARDLPHFAALLRSNI